MIGQFSKAVVETTIIIGYRAISGSKWHYAAVTTTSDRLGVAKQKVTPFRQEWDEVSSGTRLMTTTEANLLLMPLKQICEICQEKATGLL